MERQEDYFSQNEKELMEYYGYGKTFGKLQLRLRFFRSWILHSLAYFSPHPGFAIRMQRARGVKIGKGCYIGPYVHIDLLYPDLVTIEDNVAIGRTALRTNRSGDFNVAIGYRAGCGVTTQDKTINIGCEANQTGAGIACIVATCLMVAQFTATSDCRSKCKIKDLPYGLNFINLLRPVSYKWKPQADKLDKDGNLIEEGEKNHTHQRTMFGLLGQQVREATKKLGLGYNDFAGFSDQEYENKDNPDWKKSYTMEDKTIQLTYDDFIAPLIKSVQELSAEVDSLKKQLKTT